MEDQSAIFEGITEIVEMLHSSIDARDGTDCLQNRCRRVQTALNETEPLFDEFVGSLGMTERYWVMYIKMVNIARKYIRAE